MTLIDPISGRQARQVEAATAAFIKRGEAIFSRRFAAIPVHFDLRGRAAGMYRVKGREAVIRYNPWLFAKYYDDNLANTVPHEVAHYLVHQVYGLRHTRPHGSEWQTLMRSFDVPPERTTRYDLDGIPLRTGKRFAYRCDCREHSLGTVRHNRISQQRVRYHCRSCGTALQYCG